MNIKNLSFSDGQIESVGFELPYFVVYFRQWDGCRFKLKFQEVVYLELFELGSDTSDTSIYTESDKIEAVKSRILGEGGNPREYKDFKFEQVTFSSSYISGYLTIIYLECHIEQL